MASLAISASLQTVCNSHQATKKQQPNPDQLLALRGQKRPPVTPEAEDAADYKSQHGLGTELPVVKFNDQRWKKGTWDLNMFSKDGKLDWDGIILAGAKRRKFLELHPESATNDDPVVFRSSIITWCAWMMRSYLPEAELINGRAAMVGFFMAYVVDALTGLGVVGQTGNFICKELDLSLHNLCELIDLDLSSYNFNGTVSEIFDSLSVCGPDKLKPLSLAYDNFSGHLAEHVGNFKNLSHLDLSANSISGPIHVSLGNLSVLIELLIYDNQFNGTLPESIGQLKMLTVLDISYTSLGRVVSEVHFTYLTKLKDFVAAGNSLALNTSRDWLPPFQLNRLWLDYWHLGPEFPMWLQTQKQLKVLSLPNTGLSDTIPAWFPNISSQLVALNLSHNQLHGEIQNIKGGFQSAIDLSSNQFNGSLPFVSSSDRMDETKYLNSLHLGDNLLTGDIPNCLMNWKMLMMLNLKSNNLSGNIPSSIGYLKRLSSLQLHNNQLSGELPLSMQNCTDLLVVDLSENQFVGSPLTWIGKSLSILTVLNIRSNNLQGDIPYELCYLKSLQILDLAHNNRSGTISRCFHNLSAMATFPNPLILAFAEYFMDNVILFTKGRGAEYGHRMLKLTLFCRPDSSILVSNSSNLCNGH
ncbi:hypothetical protein ACE6H2_008792 [Prunus campanulata]